MSNVWQTRHRLFAERLHDLAEWLGDGGPRDPAVLDEELARLLAVALALLRQHQVNKRGQCQFCNWTRWSRRFWCRRRRCTVHQAMDLGLGQTLDFVWWHLFEDIGRTLTLAQVQKWIAERTAAPGATLPDLHARRGSNTGTVGEC